MIFVKKSDGTALQILLNAARSKGKEGDANVYRSGPVYEQLKQDFHEKCYLCEDSEATSIQIEHFDPHKGDLAKKFAWHNLFYACGHCNNSKGGAFWPLLNCTEPTDLVWESVEIRLTLFPKVEVNIQLTAACPKPIEGENTCRLLRRVLAGENATAIQTDQVKKLQKKMLRAHTELSRCIANKDWSSIKKLIADDAAFAGMWRWHLKTAHPALFDQVMGTDSSLQENPHHAFRNNLPK